MQRAYKFYLFFTGPSLIVLQCWQIWKQSQFNSMYTNLYLIYYAPPIICSRRPFQLLLLFQKYKKGMIFHENSLPADDSHEISHFIFFKNWERC